MIGQLPTSLKAGSKEYPIDSDFRTMLNIYAAFSDPELTDEEKCFICVTQLYEDFSSIPPEDIQEAVEKAYWFAGGGDIPEEQVSPARIIDWEQDERIIFPAINKVAGFETRTSTYMHWWTFLGLFGEIGEGLLSQVLHIRQKRAKGKKLEKWEQEFYHEHKGMINIKRKYTKEELAEQKKLNALLD
ncbi:MAG: hypothetical protein J6Y71_07565 [Ruminococcus sp.]|nr:hypothetical protein [Ruminococcus sp.]